MFDQQELQQLIGGEEVSRINSFVKLILMPAMYCRNLSISRTSKLTAISMDFRTMSPRRFFGRWFRNSRKSKRGPCCVLSRVVLGRHCEFFSGINQTYKVTDCVVIRLGFSQLNPQFGVRFNGGDMDRLPSACKSQNE